MPAKADKIKPALPPTRIRRELNIFPKRLIPPTPAPAAKAVSTSFSKPSSTPVPAPVKAAEAPEATGTLWTTGAAA